MNFETMIDWLGVIVAVVVLWVAARYLGRFLSWIERSEIARQQAEAAAVRNKAAAAARAAVSSIPEGIPYHHVVAIAAAVAACGYRVIHIADHATGHVWASEGRWMHQTSHQVTHRAR
jgi:hypothetical protein